MPNRERITPYEITGPLSTIALHLGGVSLSVQARHEELHRPLLWVPNGDTLRYRRDSKGEISIVDRSANTKPQERLATLQIPASHMGDLQRINVAGTPDTVHFEGNGVPLGGEKLRIAAQATGLIACTGGVRAESMELYGETVLLRDVTAEQVSGQVTRFGMDVCSEVVDRSALKVASSDQVPAFQFIHHPDSP